VCWKKYRSCPTKWDYDAYKRQRHKEQPLINEDKDNNRKQLIKSCKGNWKKFHSLMRKLQTNKIEVRELVIDNVKSVTTCDVEAARVLCDHFLESFTIEKQVDEHINSKMKPKCIIFTE